MNMDFHFSCTDVAYTYNLSISEAKAGVAIKFEACLGYMVNFRVRLTGYLSNLERKDEMKEKNKTVVGM